MPETEHRRPSPEQLLRQVEAEQRRATQGRLKISWAMRPASASLFACSTRAQATVARGRCSGGGHAVEEPADVGELLSGLEVIPPRVVDGIYAIDVEAVLRRHPQVCLIDGLAYRNPPGSKHAERWQDVEELLASGISVVTSINLQYVKERQSQVEAIRGKRFRIRCRRLSFAAPMRSNSSTCRRNIAVRATSTQQQHLSRAARDCAGAGGGRGGSAA